MSALNNVVSLVKNPGFTTSDGQHFPKRAEAVAHEVALIRAKALQAAFPVGDTKNDWLTDEVAAKIVENAQAIQLALTVKLNVGGGKKKAAAEAAAE